MSIGKTAGNKKTDGIRVRMLDGKKVICTLYNGRPIGHGKYFAGMVGDQLILGPDGRPLPFSQVGELVYPDVKK